MYKITIKNLHTEKPQNLWDIIVDRRSALGNPFYMYNEYQRDEMCDKYKRWFKDVVKNKDKDYPLQRKELNFLLDTLKQHKQLNLFCWCSPKRCHAETIKDYLFSLVNLTWNDFQDKLSELYILRKPQVIILGEVINTIEIPSLNIVIYENGHVVCNGIPADSIKSYLEIYENLKKNKI